MSRNREHKLLNFDDNIPKPTDNKYYTDEIRHRKRGEEKCKEKAK